MQDKISIVVPCYNEEAVLNDFYKEITNTIAVLMKHTNYEVIFVDDGSKDETAKIIERFSKEDSHIEFVSFSRNFGKESAMYAGLKYASGDYTVIMDADLQHSPKYIPEMYQIMQTGNYDMVATRRKRRGTEPKFSSFCSEFFYKFMNKISGINMGDNAMDYRMFNKKAKQAIVDLTEYNRFSKGIFEWIGFRTHWIKIEINDRTAGESKWSFRKLLEYAIEGCVAYSTLPLHLSSLFGLIFCFIAFIMIIVMVIQTIVLGSAGSGYATIICLILLIGGIQLFCIGILGQYLAKDYLENKKRPIFLVQKSSKEENE
ncbi:glycosyltransferase family 2 protein [Aminipila sp.]|uniref:glycosyltransferase family 2 protein n=1 Tax=Aminipila sp. TaxID=2060095 RepID=UPI00289FB68C|nr:glycosyltransferase family 2 protein [Aminipila sp.]